MVKVQIDTQLRTVDRRHQRQHIGGRPERATGVVDGVQVFKSEHLAPCICQIADAVQRVAGALFHTRGKRPDLRNWDAHIAKPRAMQVQPMHAQPLAYGGSLGGRSQQHRAAVGIGQTALQIAIHNSERRTSCFQLSQVPSGPVPQADAKAHLIQTRRPPLDGPVAPQHFRAGSKLECHVKSRYKQSRLQL